MPHRHPAADARMEVLHTLFAGSDDLVLVTDRDGRLHYSNATGPRRADPAQPPDTLYGLLAQPCAPLASARREVLASGRAQRLEVPGPGEETWLALTISPLREGEAVSGLLHIGSDITARHQEEERLRQIEELMVDTEGIAHFGVWEWDITRPHAEWTKGLYAIYGLDPATYVPSYEEYLKRVHPDDRQRVKDATDAVFHQHRPYSHDERIFHSDGSLRYLHTWAVPIFSGEGQLTHLMGVCLDVTERRLAENAVAEQAAQLVALNHDLEQRVEERTRELLAAKQAAEAANATKSLFLATMSHEVRTPMNGVLGMLELLMGSSLTVEQQHMLATIRDSSEALLGILDDILDFSKVEAGRLELEHIPVNLRRVVEGVADTLTANAQQKQLQLHCFVDPALPEWVLGDQVRLRQILFNLGSNAIKFTHSTAQQAGIVQLRAERAPGRHGKAGLRLVVVDNGIGMDAPTLQGLFTPFTQADVSTTRHFGGTGLGLSICKRLVELMDGEIRVSSQPGQGSTFSVQLALAPAQGLAHVDTSQVQGLHVIALASADETLRKLHTYIGAAGASLDVHTDSVAFEAAVTAAGPRPLVLLLGPDVTEERAAAWLAQLRTLSQRKNLQLVLLTPRQTHQLPPPPAGVVRVWIYPLHYQEFLAGLATAAGRVPALAAAELAQLMPAPTLPPDARPLVLLAEDNRVNQEITQRQLEHLGYRCLVAENGREALELWRREPVRLLLTDMQMPEMDGLELARRIRAEEQGSGRRLPIIALTANALRGETERCLEAGMDDYLSKPLRLANLRRMLERWAEPMAAHNGEAGRNGVR